MRIESGNTKELQVSARRALRGGYRSRVSKAFTSEETVDTPEVVAPRAPLPPGVTNYVTARGLALLRAELTHLRASRAPAARIAELEQRLASAIPVDPSTQAQDEVRFGATVGVRSTSGAERRYQLVGIDEADPQRGKVAFIAPIARALLGKRVDDSAAVRTPQGEDELTVISISYE